MTEAANTSGFDRNTSNRENYVSLKEYFERRLLDMERATQASLRNSETAIDKAEQATTYRLALLNESRDALKDQTRLYITRAEFDGLRDATQAEIKSLQRIVYTLTGGLAVIQALVQFFVK